MYLFYFNSFSTILIFWIFIMIDYSNSDPTKQIWNNLELYIKVMILKIFRNFVEFFWIYLTVFFVLN